MKVLCAFLLLLSAAFGMPPNYCCTYNFNFNFNPSFGNADPPPHSKPFPASADLPNSPNSAPFSLNVNQPQLPANEVTPYIRNNDLPNSNPSYTNNNFPNNPNSNPSFGNNGGVPNNPYQPQFGALLPPPLNSGNFNNNNFPNGPTSNPSPGSHNPHQFKPSQLPPPANVGNFGNTGQPGFGAGPVIPPKMDQTNTGSRFNTG